MMWGMSGMMGFMVFMVFAWLVVVVAILAGVWWLVRKLSGTRPTGALDILRERCARGEISREEYESRRRDLAA